MGASERRNKDQSMAADLIKRGYPHGKRMSTGVNPVPRIGEIGSAAYRRMGERRTSGERLVSRCRRNLSLTQITARAESAIAAPDEANYIARDGGGHYFVRTNAVQWNWKGGRVARIWECVKCGTTTSVERQMTRVEREGR